MAIDSERLIKDLRGAARDIVSGEYPADVLIGMSRAWDVIASAIEDGEYNLNPKDRPLDDIVTELEGRIRP